MKNTISRVALASTLFMQAVLLPSISAAGPILNNYTSGFHNVGSGGEQTLPPDFFQAQGFTLYELTNDQIMSSLVSISPFITIDGVGANRFTVPTLANSPCATGSGCSLVLDLEALQSSVGNGIHIDGMAVLMFQLGSLNEGSFNLTQGVTSEFHSLPFFLQDQYTGQYGFGEFATSTLDGVRIRISMHTPGGNSHSLNSQVFIAQRNAVNAVASPGTLSLVGLGAALVFLKSRGRVVAAAAVPAAAVAGTPVNQNNDPSLYETVKTNLKKIFSRTNVEVTGQLKGASGLKIKSTDHRLK